MKTNKGKPSGRLGSAKAASRRAFSKARAEREESANFPRSRRQASTASPKRKTAAVRPAGRGGRKQQAGGPEHHGLEGGEDRNP